MEYCRERGVPWGISESGYNKTDSQLNYQYRAFGVPGLGFKRGLADDLVVAPYASVMALMVEPEASCANLRRLAHDGQSGAYGFFEAIDYTPARLPRGKDHVTVRSYMAHHQGMAFLSLAYLLLDRPMQRRFDSQPAFRATDLLLQERVPRTPAIYPHHDEVAAAAGISAEGETNFRVFTTANTPAPEVQLLSNGHYHVAITNAGGGYSRWGDFAVTRWHEDPTRDCWGSFCYLRDIATGAFWSVAHQPTLKQATYYEAIFSQGRAEFRRHDDDIETHVEMTVSPEDDIELRRVKLTNHGQSTRAIELTSYAEVVLAPPAADAAHPAFSNLFCRPKSCATARLSCVRDGLARAQAAAWILPRERYGHFVAHLVRTARPAFIGRGRSVGSVTMHHNALTDSQGSVLDRGGHSQHSGHSSSETVHIHLVTGVSESREGALGLVEKYSDWHSADRVFELSWTHSQVLLRRLDVTEADTQLFARLASHILYANATLRAPKSIIARNRAGQSALWAYGISGDLPIVLVRIGDRDHLGPVRQLIKAHAYWRLKGLATDLVIWNEDPSVYRQVLQDEVMDAIGQAEVSLLDRPGGIFVRRSEQLSEEGKILMQTVARLIVSDSDAPLADQLNRKQRLELLPPLLPGKERRPVPSPRAPGPLPWRPGRTSRSGRVQRQAAPRTAGNMSSPPP
jgi:hypothetical protein